MITIYMQTYIHTYVFVVWVPTRARGIREHVDWECLTIKVLIKPQKGVFLQGGAMTCRQHV